MAVATLATVSILTTSTQAQTIGCEVGGSGGLIPATGTGGGGTFPTTLPAANSFTLNVASIPAGATAVTEVKMIGLTHTWLADVSWVITDPSGTSHMLWCRGPTGISSCDYNGDYTIVPPCEGLGLTLPTSCTGTSILPPGAYDQFFGTGTTSWPSGTNGIFNTQLDSIPAATGLWTLTAYDWAGGDSGNLTSFEVCFGLPQLPAAPTAAPALSSPADNASLYGPTINLSWAGVNCATSYEVDVDGTVYPTPGNSYAFTSTPGVHTWMARGVNASGTGPWSVVRTFTDLGLPPAPSTAPSLTAPADNASVFSGPVNLTWGTVTLATSYDLDIDGTVITGVTSPYSFVSTLGVHTWTARGANISGPGPWAVMRTFTDIGLPPSPCNGTTLVTPPNYAGGNGLGTNSVVYFDVDVLNPAGITVSQFDTNATASAGVTFSFEIYTKPGTYVGFEQNAVPWTLTASGAGITTGTGTPSLVEFPDFPLAMGVTGFACRIIGAGHTYTNGNGTNQFVANADLSITLGKSQSTLFSSAPISPRIWNGGFRYNCSAPFAYCTAGTSTHGCVPSISATGVASVSASSGFVIDIANVEGMKQGLIFYGISGQKSTPWGTGGTSFLCVKAPTQRMPGQGSGGTIGLCDGTLSTDWLDFIATHPTATGNPFSAGVVVDAQGWYRDPPAVKTTNLSDALEFMTVP
jgi:hypothetical protein